MSFLTDVPPAVSLARHPSVGRTAGTGRTGSREEARGPWNTAGARPRGYAAKAPCRRPPVRQVPEAATDAGGGQAEPCGTVRRETGRVAFVAKRRIPEDGFPPRQRPPPGWAETRAADRPCGPRRDRLRRRRGAEHQAAGRAGVRGSGRHSSGPTRAWSRPALAGREASNADFIGRLFEIMAR